ncbi:MAG: SPFH domain-containing protein [Emcibacter sp.]|nr:SPFH domain-containing protein [Emcibacter sp.]
MTQESKARTLSGYLMVFVLLSVFIVAIYFFVVMVKSSTVPILPMVILVLDIFLMTGFFMVQPNMGRILMLFGKYVGTEKKVGLRWANPFYFPALEKPISLRVRNFNGDTIKVNDKLGNPIEIGCVVVWKVVDTAEAAFEVDDYSDFVTIQSEAALRNMAASYPYDQHEEGEMSLRSHAQDVAKKLQTEVQERLKKAGVEVLETRISHLAYAPEIAHAMLQKQQASAIISARKLIVQGAVGMVEQALDQLSKKQVINLDEERKAAMVSNLLVVLCSDNNAQPIVNTGTLY